MSEEDFIGRFNAHPRGFGFVGSLTEDFEVFIPKRFTENAVDGDIVRAVYNPEGKTSKGYEGKIAEVVERKRTFLYALVTERIGKTSYWAYSPILGPDKHVIAKEAKQNLKIGDRILVSVTHWFKKQSAVEGTFYKKIGNISDASKDLESTIYEYSLPQSFPEECLEEAKSFGSHVKATETKPRRDLTKLRTCTIDPADAKDFDDALSISFDGDVYHLHVHIADVSHYIAPGTALDLEGYSRSNSTYLPGRCIPMIPEHLSNHLCSLKPGVKRLAATVEMKIDKDGELLDASIYKSVIKSGKRFTYEEAKEILDRKKKSPFSHDLHLMKDLCLLLKQKRKERGSIDFSLPEIKIVVDSKGEPQGFQTIEYDITHQLVEEFMLKTNEVGAEHWIDNNKDAIFRVHEEPTEEKFDLFYSFVRSIGYPLTEDPTIEELQEVFSKAKNTPHFHHLSINFIKSMKLAYYSEENVGHFGLSLENYVHFTSPIRRYSDLIVHRAVFNEDVGDTSDIARHISGQERQSFKAESSTIYLKKLRLLDHYFASDPYRIYAASITKCKPNGIYFEVDEFFIEGFIHISKLGKDFFVFDPKQEKIEGERSRKRFTVGAKIKVELESLDLVYRECEWVLSS